jgi:flagellar protein FlaI
MLKRKKEKDELPPIPPPPDAPMIAEAGHDGVKELVPLFAYRKIVENPEPKYIVLEPPLTEQETKLIAQVKKFLYDETEFDIESGKQNGEDWLLNLLREEIWKAINRHKLSINSDVFNKVCYYISRDFLGYGKIDPLMHDPEIEDISISGYNIPAHIILRGHRYYPTSIVYSQEELDSEILRLAYRTGRHISVAQPILDAPLPDGSRVQLTYQKEVSTRGSVIQIRRFREDPFTIVDLIMNNTLSPEIAAFLWFAIENKASVLVCGGTGTGKTSTLNVLCMFILPSLKIVTIEDTAEIRLTHLNLTSFVSRVGFGARAEERGDIPLFELLKASLRQNPDYIIVGEIRGQEAFVLMQAIATGHGGLCTIHGDSVSSIINRLISPPMNIPKEQVAECVDLYVMQGKVTTSDGKVARRIFSLSETVGFDPNTREIVTRDLFNWDPIKDSFTALQPGSRYLEKFSRRSGIPADLLLEEIRCRKTVLKWMVQRSRVNPEERHYKSVTSLIRQYYSNPSGVYEQATKELKEKGG